MTEEILTQLVQIKWILLCLTTMFWGKCLYMLGQALPGWWRSFDKKVQPEEKLTRLERMNRDLAGSVRRKPDDCPESQWD